jgi:mannosyltransferase
MPGLTLAPRRLAVSLPARLSGSAMAPLLLGVVVAYTVYLRTRQGDVGLWGDEGLSVGIADRPVTDIPSTLRQDGSPPLYYMLLHVWMSLVGRSEPQLHALSLVFAALAVPAGWWAAGALFESRRAAWFGALLFAVNPFLTQYAQEARMYSMVILLGTLACGCFGKAFLGDEPRRGWAAALAVVLATLFYTHNWGFFFAIGCGITWLALLALARGRRRALLIAGVIGFGGALVLWLPWVPTFAYQARHTGAPWSHAPTLDDLGSVPGRLLGVRAQYMLLLVGGVGGAALVRAGGWRRSPRARAAVAMVAIGVLTLVAAWISSQASPAWAGRYLAAGLAPLVLASAGGLAFAGRLGLVTLVVVAIVWSGDHAPRAKSNVRALAQQITPTVRPGDLVVSTQPEEVALLHYYLPKGLRYATLWGPVADVGVTDWRDGVDRLERTSAPDDLKPLLDSLPPGRRVILVAPVIQDMARWSAPWTELVRVRSAEWRQYLSNDPRFTPISVRPVTPPPKNNQWQATVAVKE